jgi:hypothetical protein
MKQRREYNAGTVGCPTGVTTDGIEREARRGSLPYIMYPNVIFPTLTQFERDA